MQNKPELLDVATAAASKLLLNIALLAIGGAVILLGWNLGVSEIITACGGHASNINLLTGIFVGISLSVIGALLSKGATPSQPPQPTVALQPPSEEQAALARKFLKNLGGPYDE